MGNTGALLLDVIGEIICLPCQVENVPYFSHAVDVARSCGRGWVYVLSWNILMKG